MMEPEGTRSGGGDLLESGVRARMKPGREGTGQPAGEHGGSRDGVQRSIGRHEGQRGTPKEKGTGEPGTENRAGEAGPGADGGARYRRHGGARPGGPRGGARDEGAGWSPRRAAEWGSPGWRAGSDPGTGGDGVALSSRPRSSP